MEALRSNLCRKTERVGGMRTSDLRLRAGLAGERTCDVVGRRRERTKLWMHAREIIEATCETTQLSVTC